MAIVLHFMGSPVFEVLSVGSDGDSLVVGALWPDPKLHGVGMPASKASLRLIYKPMEMDDALVAKLRA